MSLGSVLTQYIFLPISSTSQGSQRGPNSALRNSFFMSHLISLLLAFYRSCAISNASFADSPRTNQFQSTSIYYIRASDQFYGPKSFGPKSFGPKLFGPKFFGPKFFGPEFFGPEIFGPKFLGPNFLDPIFLDPIFLDPISLD